MTRNQERSRKHSCTDINAKNRNPSSLPREETPIVCDTCVTEQVMLQSQNFQRVVSFANGQIVSMNQVPEIDLRSDTVTKPTPAMRQAMAEAEVGDDVICVDPTVERLQNTVAEMFGMEAALFVPSGSMANQIAVRCHCQPGDELICEAECHIYKYEQGGFAQLSGVSPKLLAGQRGILEPGQFEGTVNPDDDHAVRTSLICLENTHNRGGGTVQPLEKVSAICTWAKDMGLKRHLDGARLFNAIVASGIEAKRWSKHFDTLSVCFSKGLGAPVGSALIGSADFIRRARRIRKLLGGGMRQAGIIAAGALYALEYHIQRLDEDHDKAMLLASSAQNADGVSLDALPETNIVLLRIDPALGKPVDFVQQLARHGVGAFPFGEQFVRLVTHMDVSDEQIHRACDAILASAESMSLSAAP
jgi:threonine aldolase